MKKILFLIHDLGQGGAEKVLVNLVNNLDRTKFDITVMSLFGGGVNEQFLKKDICYKTVYKKNIPANSRWMKLWSPEQLHQKYVKDKYDIEIAYLEGPAARIVSGCRDKGTKLISWIHVQQYTKEMAAKVFRNYEEAEKCYQKFHKIVCVSESVKEDFLSLFPTMKDVDVKYNTNETDEILRLKDEPVEEGIFKEGEIRLCGVGKLMPIKGFDKLARIHKRLREEGYPVHTYVLGDGPEREKIETYIKENHLGDSFTFLGYQTNPYKYVAKCDLFVCTSTAEGFSTAATEALIVGTPVVTTPVAGMKEMLGENNEYGIVAGMSEETLFEKIKLLLDCSEKLEDYKKRAMERGKDFSKGRTIASVEKYFEEIEMIPQNNVFEIKKEMI